MLNDVMMESLVADFKEWGLEACNRIISKTIRYGVLCSSTKYSDGKNG